MAVRPQAPARGRGEAGNDSEYCMFFRPWSNRLAEPPIGRRDVELILFVIGRDRGCILTFPLCVPIVRSSASHSQLLTSTPHKDGHSRERILPTTAMPPCPSGLTIAASPKLIWMPSAALMFGKCVISTVLVRSRAGQTLLRPSQSPALRLAFDGLRGEHRGFFQHSKVRILAPQPASPVSAV